MTNNKKILMGLNFILIILLSSCSHAPTAYAPNFNSALLKQYPVFKDDIKVNKKINLQAYNNLLIVAFNADANDIPARKKMKLFFLDAIKNTHAFKHVLLLDNLPTFLNQHGQYKLSKLDYNYSSSIAKLASRYPGVLLINFYTEDFSNTFFGHMHNTLTLEISNPRTSQVYLKIRYSQDSRHINQFYYAAVNGVREWISKNN